MKPYYDEDGITIYHGDCREILPELSADLVLTDPPYGISKWNGTGGNSLRPEEVSMINAWDHTPDIDTLGQVVAAGKHAIVWGGNYFDLGPTRSPLVWDKAQRGMHFADGELAWTNFTFGTLRIFYLPLAGTESKGSARLHPTQKPVSLMKWCINQLPQRPETVLDPFMGSGSTLKAARELGISAIGIEIEERYCEIAVQRLAQGVLQFDSRGI